jgi:hypothetical protein
MALPFFAISMLRPAMETSTGYVTFLTGRSGKLAGQATYKLLKTSALWRGVLIAFSNAR